MPSSPPQAPGELIRLRLDLGYDGTDFSGWAAQPGQRTVAGLLSGELTRLLAWIENLTAAGRTDAGVHATGQVCHVDVPADAWPPLAATLVERLAGLLPPDLRVYGAALAPPGFDARFAALWRRYEYRVADASWGAPPLRARDTLHWPRTLDLPAMQEAAVPLRGEHDFAAFCRHKPQASTVRTVTDLDWRRDLDGVLIATVQADAFCQAMVRSLVGALLAVGAGRRPASWPGELLQQSSRASEVMVAPPHGLTLVQVGYPADPAGYRDRIGVTRRRRSPLSASTT